MARHSFDWVSFDATAWRAQAQYAKYLNPHDLSADDLSSKVMIDENIMNDCECPFCKGKTFTYLKNLPDTDKTAFLRNHNWWVIEKVTKDLYQNWANTVELRNFLKRKSRKTEMIEELC